MRSNEQAVEKHSSAVADQAGGIDVSFNAVGIPQKGVQGIPLVELSPENFAVPIMTYTRAHFLTARAAARHMIKKGSGVILTITATPARSAAPLVGGMAPAWAAMEALSRSLAAELARPMTRIDAARMLKRRLAQAGIVTSYSPHSFRASGLTRFLEEGGTLEGAQNIADHADSRTTKLCDRRQQIVLREDVERIRYWGPGKTGG
jgi:NAD(P)-dependent dehydrogenase (short-subunit alcohol dehydrogenase family)